MGRVPGVPAQLGQWVHGEPGMPGIYSATAQGVGVPYYLRRGASFRRTR